MKKCNNCFEERILGLETAAGYEQADSRDRIRWIVDRAMHRIYAGEIK
jgi:hypothetical protein